jgi:hypothetical protein
MDNSKVSTSVGWFSDFFKDLSDLGFRKVYKTCPSSLLFKNYFSRNLCKVSKVWEKYFHPGFKVPILTDFRPINI